MNQKSWLLNLSLLKTHPAYRAVFIARFISILSLGLLGVAVPVQIQTMTHSSWLVGLSVTLTGGAMFIGLMVGGVLADRYERKKLILLARGTRGVGFIGLCLNAMLPEPSLMAIYALGLWDGFFASLGVTALLAAPRAQAQAFPDDRAQQNAAHHVQGVGGLKGHLHANGYGAEAQSLKYNKTHSFGQAVAQEHTYAPARHHRSGVDGRSHGQNHVFSF